MTNPPETSRIYVVDRREGRMLVLVDDGDVALDLAASRLPRGCRSEGAVLRVPLDAGGNPLWAEARRDRAEEARRVADLTKRAERLRRRDPGGDVVL